MAPLLQKDKVLELPHFITSNEDPGPFLGEFSVRNVKTNAESRASNVSYKIGAVYFDVLETNLILCFMLDNFSLIVYKLFISKIEAGEIKEVAFKKIMVEHLNTYDFREFYIMNKNNIFVGFDNVFNRSGVFFNLENNHKIIYEKQGEICLFEFDHDKTKLSTVPLCAYSDSVIENGFVFFSNAKLKQCKLCEGYKLESNSMLIHSNLINRFPLSLTYIPTYLDKKTVYTYILTEKEMKENNKFVYYLTLRTEESNLISSVEFSENETVSCCNCVELPSQINNATELYISVGVNVVDKENKISGKLQLYEIGQENLNLVSEDFRLKPMISMINSSNGYLIIGEGSKINCYKFNPTDKTLIKQSEFDNKNGIAYSRIQSDHLLIGDIQQSITYFMIKKTNESFFIYEVCKDVSFYSTSSLTFWIDKLKRHGSILFDRQGNGHVFVAVNEEKNNSYFMEICDFYIGKNVNEIWFSLYKNQKGTEIYFYSKSNGSIGFISLLDSSTFDYLNILAEFLYSHFQWNSGCNPKAHFRAKNFPYKKPKGRFVDYKVLRTFELMSDRAKDEIATMTYNGAVDFNACINDIKTYKK